MHRRLEMLRSTLEEEGVDAIVVASAYNRRYLSGFTGSAGALAIGKESAHLLTDFRYVEQAGRQAPAYQVVQVRDYNEVLKELFQKIGARRVAFEQAHVTVKTHSQRQEALADIEWVPTENWVERLRAVKDDDELAKIQDAVDLADRAFNYIVERLDGRTEKEVAFDLEFFLRREGADRLSFPSIIASGPNGALPHATPTDRTITRGDFVTLDFGAELNGYCSDMTRTVAIGQVDDRQREIYELVLKAQIAGVEAVKPGRLGKEVDQVARSIIEEAGYGDQFGHGLGHGVGLEVHDPAPTLSPRGDEPLKPGMVVSVEPGIYIPGWGGVRIEDLVVVTEDGCRILCSSSKELMEV